MRHFAIVVLLVLITGCVTTNVTAYKDPVFEDTRFENLAVYFDVSDLGDRKAMEYAVAKAALGAGYTITPSIEVVPPTRIEGPEAFVNALTAAGHDGALLISVMNSGIGSSIYAEFKTTLIELPSTGTAWSSSASASGSAEYSGWSEVMRSYATETVTALVADNLLDSQESP